MVYVCLLYAGKFLQKQQPYAAMTSESRPLESPSIPKQPARKLPKFCGSGFFGHQPSALGRLAALVMQKPAGFIECLGSSLPKPRKLSAPIVTGRSGRGGPGWWSWRCSALSNFFN